MNAETAWRAVTVLHSYCRAIDDRDATALTEVFTEDVVLAVTPIGSSEAHRFEGREAVVALLSSLFDQRDWSRHMVSNPLVDLAADGVVRVRSYFTFTMASGTTRTRGIGDYTASMRDADGGLLITELDVGIADETVSTSGE
jgi:3-phenylpropionate/cinnamic acid dioxygenase small subunit